MVKYISGRTLTKLTFSGGVKRMTFNYTEVVDFYTVLKEIQKTKNYLKKL